MSSYLYRGSSAFGFVSEKLFVIIRAEIDVGALPDMIDKGELRPLGTQCCSTQELCDLFDILYNKKPVSPVRVWEAEYDENVLLLPAGHGQRQITALVAAVRRQHVGEERVDLIFNLEHDADDEQKTIFAVAGDGLEHLANWVKVADVLGTYTDRQFLKHAGVMRIDDSRFDKYTRHLARVRAILDYGYPMEIQRRPLARPKW